MAKKILNTVTVNKITKEHFDEEVNAGTITPTMIKNQIWHFTDDQYVSEADIARWNSKLDGLVMMKYGTSTWDDFIDAYNNNKVVYCLANGRLAFMAYTNNNGVNPTEVEFQYYRSIATHTTSQQGDQVFIYKLKNNDTWTTTTREAATKIVAGTGMSSSYSSGTLTLNATTTGDKNFVYTQTEALATWNIQHNLGKYPAVMVTDSAGTVVEGLITYTDENNITITFSSGFKGKAILN